ELPLGKKSPCWTGSLSGTEILVAVTGVGARCAARVAEIAFDCWQPELLVIAGVAGALSADLGVGHIVVAGSVVGEGETWIPTAEVFDGTRHGYQSGTLLSLD